MNRLTYRTDNGEYTGMPNSIEIRTALEKLSKIEDIEEELGIDLITLFKALKQKEVYIRESFCQEVLGHWEINKTLLIYLDYVGDNEAYYDFINKEWVLTFTEWENGFDYHEMLVRLKDYGKTWALTKEELENEN